MVMIRGVFLGLVLGAAALALPACGDDDEDDDGGDGGGGTSGTGGMAGEGTGGGGMTVECTPGGGGACQNEMDCPAVESGEAREDTGDCGLSCLQNDDPPTCTVACVMQEAGLSMGCAVCYATLVGCATDNCLAECGTTPDAPDCTRCQIDSGCRGAYDDCSGLMTAP